MRAPLPLALVLAASACQPADIDRVLVMERAPDGSYALNDRELPELHDHRRVDGVLGRGRGGGLLAVTGYKQGSSLDVRYDAVDGVGIPHDEDGLVLWSFYAHLADIRADLRAGGYDVDPLFPLDAIAFNPVSAMDFQAVENAAYSPGNHIFALFPDLIRTGVPLAGNAGVVRHELGHAWFQLLTVGDVHRQADYALDLNALGVRALNEGFADMVATLTLDDPEFFEASLSQPSRDVRGNAAATPALYPEPDPGPFAALLFDPYALGTVFASLAWDVRIATDDPELVLELVVEAVQAWAAEAHWTDIDA